MTREDAIKKVRQLSLPKETMEILEALAPELAESEDERIRKALIWHLKADADFVSNGVTKAECISWLEKQKEQKPAEWSEEDENTLRYLHELISFGYTQNFVGAQTAADMRRWLNTRLKSLRPVSKESLQSHWKPSEEQMDALLWCTAHLGGADRRVLAELYEHLKKLM